MGRYKPIYAQTRGRRWLKRLLVLLILMIIGGLGYGGYWLWQRQKNQITAGFPVQGIAVSQDDGYLDFDALQQRIQFVYVRATQGASYIDDNFESNYSRADGRSLAVGVYHVFSFNSSAKAQAAYFEQQVGGKTGSLPIAVQVAYYGNYDADNLPVKKVQTQLRSFLLTLAKDYNRPCVVWTTPSLAKKVVKPVIKHSKLIYDTTATHSQSKRVTFIHYSDEVKYRLDGSTVRLNGLLYNGSQASFEQSLHE